MPSTRALALAALALGACARAEPITTCDDELRGVYAVQPAPGAPGAPGPIAHPRDVRRWMVLDHRRTLEVYPLFDDNVDPPAGLEVAPRVIDLERTAELGGLVGRVRRRYLRGADRCDAQAPARITSCSDDTLEIVLADPVPPIGFDPCVWGQRASSRRERWRRE